MGNANHSQGECMPNKMKTGICAFSGKDTSTRCRDRVVVIKGVGGQHWLVLDGKFRSKFVDVITNEANRGDDSQYGDSILGYKVLDPDCESGVTSEFDLVLFKQGAPIGQVVVFIRALHAWSKDLLGYLNSASTGGIAGGDSRPRSQRAPRHQPPPKKKKTVPVRRRSSGPMRSMAG